MPTDLTVDLDDALLGISKFVARFYRIDENSNVPLAVPFWLIRQASTGYERAVAQVALDWSDREGHTPEEDVDLIVSIADRADDDKCPDEDHAHAQNPLDCGEMIHAKVQDLIYEWSSKSPSFREIDLTATGSPK